MFKELEYICEGQTFSFYVYKQYEVLPTEDIFMLMYKCKDGDEDFLGNFNTLKEAEEYVNELEYIKIKSMPRFKRYINHFSDVYSDGRFEDQGRPVRNGIKKKPLAKRLKQSTSKRYKSYGYLNAMRDGMSRFLIKE